MMTRDYLIVWNYHFNHYLGDNMTNVKQIYYIMGWNISANYTSKANINMNKRARHNKHEMIFFDNMFIDDFILC